MTALVVDIDRHRGEEKIAVEIVTITPDIAKAWLDKNIKNRHIAARYIRLFARDMRNHAWMLTGETIKFSWDGYLLDGQTRLTACIESNTPFRSLVVYGVDPRSQDVMDTGKARTGADILEQMNIDKQTAALIVPVARMIHQLKHSFLTYLRPRPLRTPQQLCI